MKSRQIILFDTESNLRAHFQDGKSEGQAEGQEEERKKWIKRMLSNSFSLEQIAEISGLSMDEIKAL